MLRERHIEKDNYMTRKAESKVSLSTSQGT